MLTFPPRRSFFPGRYCLSLTFLLLIAGCESTPHRAPVIDSSAVESRESKTGADAEAADQRSGFHTVQKGDTLYSIARSRGIDQKDLAEWNNIQDPTTIHIGQQLTLSSPSRLSQPSLFALPPPMPPAAAVVAAPNAVPIPSLEEKPGINTDKLKVEPKAFKLAYSEQAVAQLKGSAVVPPIVVAKAAPVTEKNVGTEISPVAPVAPAAEAMDNVDRVEWIWPAKGKILEGFSEITKGIDIAGNPGQSVAASAGGKVVYSGAGLRGYGKLIIIKHNNTYLSAYAHNDKILVKEGQTVTKGQKIAEMGNTDTTVVKLHFEIRKNGKPVDPLKYLPELSG
ncbi:peptidase M23 [Nitrosospira lacus]|uniref:Peptidase M23 n=1 Tax=Nitrosospira lacus TaxID=1288494 RepID=A0A1W6ST93_9PROT|nr:peptidoglycan DD-metalloendopeptidase family protein [Nitrosospira lacus]ARO89021.1 peptidase M23 [Nitrosospira lacus]